MNKAHLEDGDGRPQDVVEMFPVALASLVFADDHFAAALPRHPFNVSVLAKLTAEQVHSQYTAKIQNNAHTMWVCMWFWSWQ